MSTPRNKAGSAHVPSRFHGYDGEPAEPAPRAAPVETPIAIVYAPKPFAVMMATPADLEDFAVGFSFTEGIIDTIDDIRAIAVEEMDEGLQLVVSLAADKMQRHLSRGRALSGRTGCGLCGIEDLGSLPRAKTRARSGQRLDLAAVRRSLIELDTRQPLNDATRAVHAAAWCDRDGAVLLVREDVGRHNALDKLIGALLRGGVAPLDGFILITSRCSFEMVEKAAAFGAHAIVAISAPTTLAIERATLHGMILVGIARSDGATVFAGEARIHIGAAA